MTDALTDAQLAHHGVRLSYDDVHGRTHTTAPETLDRLRDALATGPDHTPGPVVVDAGAHHRDLHGIIHTDDAQIPVAGTAPADLPYGRYQSTAPDGSTRPLVLTPPTLPQAPTGWGWSVQLYAARTPTSWGIGDFADLATIADRVARDGAQALLVSPVHATHPAHPLDSPYSPASREWLNLLHVAVDHVPGVDLVDLTDLRNQAAILNRDPLIDRAAVWELKREALVRIFTATTDQLPASFEEFVHDGGQSLTRFCLWSVLADTHDGPWWEWPTQYQHPGTDAVAQVADDHPQQLRFWAWCQWVADTQLGAACDRGVDVVLDLAVGFDAGSCDGWAYQDLLALGFEVGCPPDRNNLEGQKWGLPPFLPAALTAAGYEPWLAYVRAALRHARGLRIDHVMALWRLYWVPSGSGAHLGAYVQYPAEDLLGLLRLEAHKAGAWVVGEDMGTVEDTVREQMDRIGMLGYRVATRTAPEEFPPQVMAAAETHDQPTIAGVVTGADLAECVRVGKAVDVDKVTQARAALLARVGLKAEAVSPAQVEEVVEAVYRDVAASAARLVLVSVDDAAAVEMRPNIPGAPVGYPCWNLGLPGSVTDLLDAPLARRVVETMTRLRPTPAE